MVDRGLTGFRRWAQACLLLAFGCGFPEGVVVLRAEFGGSSLSAQNDKQQSNSKSKSRSPFGDDKQESNYDNCGYCGGGMRTVFARQERMGPQAVGWRDLSRQTSTAVR